LLDRLKSKIEETYTERTGEVEVRDVNPVLSELFKMHQYAIHGRVLYRLKPEWTQQAQDKESLYRLYYLIFHSIMNIEYRFSGFFADLDLKKINYDMNLGTDKPIHTNTPAPHFPPHLFINIIQGPDVTKSVKVFKEWGLKKEVLDVWQSTFNLK
jgi:hypothetical protein